MLVQAKIPDIEKCLDVVATLEAKKGTGEVRFNLYLFLCFELIGKVQVNSCQYPIIHHSLFVLKRLVAASRLIQLLRWCDKNIVRSNHHAVTKTVAPSTAATADCNHCHRSRPMTNPSFYNSRPPIANAATAASTLPCLNPSSACNTDSSSQPWPTPNGSPMLYLQMCSLYRSQKSMSKGQLPICWIDKHLLKFFIPNLLTIVSMYLNWDKPRLLSHSSSLFQWDRLYLLENSNESFLTFFGFEFIAHKRGAERIAFSRSVYKTLDEESNRSSIPELPSQQNSSAIHLLLDSSFAIRNMVVIEPEQDVTETGEATDASHSRSVDAPQGGSCNDEESFEDALTEEQLREKALKQANDAKEEGNKLFRTGQYEDALLKYELALQIASEVTSSVDVCSMCHGNRAACFLKLDRYKETVQECTKALELNPSYIKALFRRAEAHEKLENYDEAIADMKKVLELDPANDQARKNIRRLEPIAAEKREKMKEEMIGKLKEMGNSLLGRFGMNLDNFKAVKDPNTGSYSISFQQ
ncbi:unnamed protein product [Musa hybrid cultivar]